MCMYKHEECSQDVEDENDEGNESEDDDDLSRAWLKIKHLRSVKRMDLESCLKKLEKAMNMVNSNWLTMHKEEKHTNKSNHQIIFWNNWINFIHTHTLYQTKSPMAWIFHVFFINSNVHPCLWCDKLIYFTNTTGLKGVWAIEIFMSTGL